MAKSSTDKSGDPSLAKAATDLLKPEAAPQRHVLRNWLLAVFAIALATEGGFWLVLGHEPISYVLHGNDHPPGPTTPSVRAGGDATVAGGAAASTGSAATSGEGSAIVTGDRSPISTGSGTSSVTGDTILDQRSDEGPNVGVVGSPGTHVEIRGGR